MNNLENFYSFIWLLLSKKLVEETNWNGVTVKTPIENLTSIKNFIQWSGSGSVISSTISKENLFLLAYLEESKASLRYNSIMPSYKFQVQQVLILI